MLPSGRRSSMTACRSATAARTVVQSVAVCAASAIVRDQLGGANSLNAASMSRPEVLTCYSSKILRNLVAGKELEPPSLGLTVPVPYGAKQACDRLVLIQRVGAR